MEDKGFIVGKRIVTKEPLAVVTRNNDHVFPDIINWVVQALFYGEEQGMTKDSSLCLNYTTLTSNVPDLMFLNAVYCVGNYGEIVIGNEQNNRGMNQINNGSNGMLYATPFGDLRKDDGDLFISISIDPLLGVIRKENTVNCGIVVPDEFPGNATRKSGELVGMNVDYCHTLAAALFHGNDKSVKLFIFSENDSLAALDNGTIDALAGARIEMKYDFASQSLGGFHFSAPYYYGNETDVGFVSLATREDDVVFSSFVNCVVLATIYTQENINRGLSSELPLSPIFGSDFNWALRDAIAYSGSYDQLYKAFW